LPKKPNRETKAKIVNAAWKLFYEQGYDNTSVEEIVFESGTSRGSFYHYFDGKDQLLNSLSYLFDNKYEELQKTMPNDLSAFEKLLFLNRELFRMMENGTPKIIAKAECPIQGGIDLFKEEDKSKLNKGISRLLDTILEKTGIEVKSAYVNIQNAYVRTISTTGEISIIPRDIVTCQNVGEVLNEASAVNYNDDESLIDIVPVAFYTDGKLINEKPEGIECSTLSIDANAVIAQSKVIKHITEILGDLDMKVDGFIPSFFSAQKVFDSSSFLAQKSRSPITVIADVGGEKTDISVYYKNIPFAFDTIKAGGNNITRDIAYVLDVNENSAQRLKMDYCYASSEAVQTQSAVTVETTKNDMTEVQVSYIADIMNARIIEITKKVVKAAEKLLVENNCPLQPQLKVYFIGDGFVHFKGITKVLQDELENGNVEVVDKGKELGIKTSFITSLGMLLYISSKIKYGRRSSLVVNRNEDTQEETQEEDLDLLESISKNIKQFFKGIVVKFKQTIDKFKS